MSHTPGPWTHRRIEKGGLYGFTVDTADAEVEICEIYPKSNPVAVNGANARLISAAPDMLEALRAARTVWDNGCVDRGYKDQHNWIDDAIDLIDAAIAKAEGRED